MMRRQTTDDAETNTTPLPESHPESSGGEPPKSPSQPTSPQEAASPQPEDPQEAGVPKETATPPLQDEVVTDGVPITTSQSMFDLTSSDPRRGTAKTRRSPPSRSTSEDSGKCSVAGHTCVDTDRFRASVQVQSRERSGRLVDSAC
ncbi:uncharacterized protein LOC121876310 [Homarus americanus]|nr:uncharacterized protein LOC121876310 [Homarus americanus]